MNEKLGRRIPLTMENIKNKKTSGYVIYFPLYILSCLETKYATVIGTCIDTTRLRLNG